MKGWKSFDREYKERAHVRYFIYQTMHRKIVLPIKWKYEAIWDYVRYRTWDKYHVLQTGLAPDYISLDRQMLHVNFHLLKEFVEVEQAWSSYAWSEERKDTWQQKHLPFYRFFKPFRRPDLGIKHFEWAATLDDPALPPHEQSPKQAQDAREVLALYKWWVTDRPSRIEIPIPVREERTVDDMYDLFDEDEDPVKKKARFDIYEQREEQSTSWDQEDTEMLIRLIKIRSGLWT